MFGAGSSIVEIDYNLLVNWMRKARKKGARGIARIADRRCWRYSPDAPRSVMNFSHRALGDTLAFYNDIRPQFPAAELSPPDTWSYPHNPMEDPREVGLITHPTVDGDA